MSLGPLEIILIVAVIALLFGAKKLPELMKGMGKGMREFKAEVSDLNRTDHPDGAEPITLRERPAEPAVLVTEPRRADVVTPPSSVQIGDRR